MTTSSLGMPTGFSVLDQTLPHRGWLVAGLTEILIPTPGIGELRVLIPMLRSLTKSGRTVVFLAPPSLSYAPVLIQHGIDLKYVRVVRNTQPLEGLASIETSLKNGDFSAIVAWLPAGSDTTSTAKEQRDALRRLQLAARLSHCPAVLFRSASTDPVAIDAMILSASQVHLQLDVPLNDTVRVRRLDPQRNDPSAAITLSLPPASVRTRPLAPSLFAHATGNTVEASVSARGSLRHSLASLASALSPQRDAPPTTRAPWPFKQRRRNPDTPAARQPSANRLARPVLN